MTDGTVKVGTGGMSSRFLKEDWPITEGLTAGTTKTDGRTINLVAEDSNIKDRDRVLI